MILNNGKHVALAPQGLAELIPQVSTSYYYPEGVGMELETRFAWYGEIFTRQPWVYTVVSKRANAIARLPLAVWNEGGPTRQLDTSSGYAKLLAQPCPYLDPYRFWFWIQATRDIYGEAFLAIQRDKSSHKPVALLPMHPSRVAVKRAPDTGRYTYLFQSGTSYGTGLVQFDQDDVVPFLDHNPLRLERGGSRLEPLRSTIMNEDSSRNAMNATWKNAGRPNMVLATDKRLGREGRERLRDSFQSTHSGSSQAGRALVLEDGLKATPIQMTATELQWIQSRQLDREEIAAVFDISPPIVHILDRATFSNITALERAFYRDTMAPPIESIESILDHYIGRYWQGQKAARFALDDVLRGDFEVRAGAARALATVGALTPNEVRELMGYSPYAGADAFMADRLLANAAQQLLGAPAEQIRLTGIPTHDPDDIPLALPHGATPVDTTDSDLIDDDAALPEAKALDYTSRPVRELRGGIGRGADVRELALKLAEKYPDALDQILLAVQIAIKEKNRAA